MCYLVRCVIGPVLSEYPMQERHLSGFLRCWEESALLDVIISLGSTSVKAHKHAFYALKILVDLICDHPFDYHERRLRNFSLKY